MKILFATSEMVPYVKSGGLADVAGALPDALSELGAEVHVIMPNYGIIPRKWKHRMKPTAHRIKIQLGERTIEPKLLTLRRKSGVTVWFLDIPEFYDRKALYGEDNQLYPDSFARFIALSKATIELAKHIQPQILHANDWFTAFVPIALKEHAQKIGELTNTRSLLTIHNLAYQGIFWYYDWPMLNLPQELFSFDKLEFYGHINLLKGGIVWADAINTVSPTYAEEIRKPEFGFGLESVLEYYSNKLVGILNGIDTKVWNPEIDPYLKHKFSAHDLSGKQECRKELIERFGLSANEDTPVIGMIGRLVEQKGWPLIQRAINELTELDAVFVFLGAGNKEFEVWLEAQREWFPEKIGVYIGYDEAMAHLVTAGSDIFLMPSRFEPCGLNQMYALSYATPVVAHATGGLKDSIIDINTNAEHGTGWLFDEYSHTAMFRTVRDAMDTFKHNPGLFERMRQNAINSDFSWEHSARKYMKLYHSIAVEE